MYQIQALTGSICNTRITVYTSVFPNGREEISPMRARAKRIVEKSLKFLINDFIKIFSRFFFNNSTFFTKLNFFLPSFKHSLHISAIGKIFFNILLNSRSLCLFAVLLGIVNKTMYGIIHFPYFFLFLSLSLFDI